MSWLKNILGNHGGGHHSSGGHHGGGHSGNGHGHSTTSNHHGRNTHHGSSSHSGNMMGANYQNQPAANLNPSQQCQNCQTLNQANAKFCQGCGIQIALPHCTQCGSKIDANAQFCSQCGNKV